MSTSDIGYEIDGSTVWFHPYRLDSWETFQADQKDTVTDHLREEMRQLVISLGEEHATPSDFKAVMTKAELKSAKATRDSLLLLFYVRGFHQRAGGYVYNMSEIGPLIEATWLPDIVLDNVGLPANSIYVHFGKTLGYAPGAPEGLIEGAYFTPYGDRKRSHGWRFTFVTNFPDWANALHQDRSETDRLFARYLSFEIPHGFRINVDDVGKLKVEGDPELIACNDIGRLVRFGASALMFFNQAAADITPSFNSLRSEITRWARDKLFQCDFHWDGIRTDWLEEKLRPGRWRVVDSGGPGTPITVEWVRPAKGGSDQGGTVLDFDKHPI